MSTNATKQGSGRRKTGVSVVDSLLHERPDTEINAPVGDERRTQVSVTPRVHAVIRSIADLSNLSVPVALDTLVFDALVDVHKNLKQKTLADLRAKLAALEEPDSSASSAE